MKDSFKISINNTGFNKTNKTATIRTHKIVRQSIYVTGMSNGCLLKHTVLPGYALENSNGQLDLQMVYWHII